MTAHLASLASLATFALALAIPLPEGRVAALAFGLSSPREAPRTPFPRRSRHATGKNPGSVAIADVNRDGKRDLLVANEASANMTVLLGDGTGAFTPAPGSPFAAGDTPNDLAIGDFDRNGTLDVAVPNHETKNVTLLLGDGTGRFAPSPASPITVRSRPHAHGVAAGDFDGDGNLDLAVESFEEDAVEVLYGDGKGRFEAPGRTFKTGGRVPYQRLRAGDLDRDGRTDLVTTNIQSGSVSVLLGSASRSMRAAAGSPFATGPSPFSHAIADVDGDGALDVVVAGYAGSPEKRSADGVHLLLGDGKGGLKERAGSPYAAGPSPIGIAAGDLDGDGRADVASPANSGDAVDVFRGTKDGLVKLATVPVGKGPEAVAIGDVNGDGKGDIAVCVTQEDAVVVLLSR
jgi:hypothetical protein